MAGELITDSGQLEFNGYLLGDNVNTFTEQITGWDDLPGVDSGNTLRPSNHGAWSGRKLLTQRVITWEGRFAPPKTSWSTQLTSLRNALIIPLDTSEQSIVVQDHTDKMLVYGAVSARALPLDDQYGYYGAKVSVQFECSDPRRYSLVESTIFVGFVATTTSAALAYPLVYPLDYGTEIISEGKTVVVGGNFPTQPRIVFDGPMTNPALVNSTTGRKLGFNIALASTDQLIVDTKAGTVLLNGTSDRLYTRMFDTVAISSFVLDSGSNSLQMIADSYSGNAGATVYWRDATL